MTMPYFRERLLTGVRAFYFLLTWYTKCLMCVTWKEGFSDSTKYPYQNRKPNNFCSSLDISSDLDYPLCKATVNTWLSDIVTRNTRTCYSV